MKNLYVLFLVLLGANGFSQTLTPEFEFQLYFEDAAGNKDTVTIGSDALATAGIDADFGEVNILNEPWGDSLDVRIGNLVYNGGTPANGIEGKWCLQPDDDLGFNCDIDTNTHLSKKQIMLSHCLSNSDSLDLSSTPNRISIQFYSASYPVTIRWDKNLFDTVCKRSVFISYSFEYHWDLGGYVLLENEDSLVVDDLGDSTLLSSFLGDFLLPAYYTENNKKIGALQFLYGANKISDVGIKNNTKEKTTIYPNPIKQKEYLNVNTAGSYSIIDITGKAVQSGEIENNRIFIQSIYEGMYLLKIKTHTDKYYTTKILVQ